MFVESVGFKRCEVCIYNFFFKFNNLIGVEGGFLFDFNFDSEIIYLNVLVEFGFDEVRKCVFWFEVVGEDKFGKGGFEFVWF